MRTECRTSEGSQISISTTQSHVRDRTSKRKAGGCLPSSGSGCIEGVKCKFSHSMFEKLYHPLMYKTSPCDVREREDSHLAKLQEQAQEVQARRYVRLLPRHRGKARDHPRFREQARLGLVRPHRQALRTAAAADRPLLLPSRPQLQLLLVLVARALLPPQHGAVHHSERRRGQQQLHAASLPILAEPLVHLHCEPSHAAQTHARPPASAAVGPPLSATNESSFGTLFCALIHPFSGAASCGAQVFDSERSEEGRAIRAEGYR